MWSCMWLLKQAGNRERHRASEPAYTIPGYDDSKGATRSVAIQNGHWPAQAL